MKKMKNMLKDYFGLQRDIEDVKKALSQLVIIDKNKNLYHRFKVITSYEVEYYNVRTGAKYSTTYPAIVMRLDNGDWTELK